MSLQPAKHPLGETLLFGVGLGPGDPDYMTVRARDILTPSPVTIDVEDFAVEALARMQARNITQLVVTEQGRFNGFIHLHDLLREGLV